MTVAELIVKLGAMPQDLIVAWNYDDYEYHEVREVGVTSVPANMHPRAEGKYSARGVIPEGVSGRVDASNGELVELFM